MENTGVKDRLNEFCRSIDVSKNKFEQNCGLTRGYMANPTTKPSVPVLERIHAVYPDLNMNWVLFGEGTMLLSDSNAVNTELDPIKHNIEVYTDDALHYELDKVKALLKEKTDALAFITKEFTEMTSERNDYKEKFLEAQSKYIALLEKMSEGNIDSLSHTA